VTGQAHSVALVGLRAVRVAVEAHVGSGLPGVSIIGSSGSAGREAAERVRTALTASAMGLPNRKALVSLAPADVAKSGARFDLATAAAVAAELGYLGQAALDRCALLGELALDGSVRPVRGVLPAAAFLARHGPTRLMVADGNAAEARLVDGIDVVPVSGLSEAVAVLRGEHAPRPLPGTPPEPGGTHAGDLADVRGQAEARRGLEIAAAGGHHLLLLGPPGCGKSMLAQRLPSVLPGLSRQEALELASVRSVAGLTESTGVLDHSPPFRAPHHRTSAAALLGGGSGIARPGQLSLAHRGVLFLDELFEWPRRLLDALREPLEEGVVRLARAEATVQYPSRVQLVAAANPCPCGGGDRCQCGDEEVWAYRAKLSGPLADRLDLAPIVEPLKASDVLSAKAGEDSAAVAARVAAARSATAKRWGPRCNAAADAEEVRRVTASAALRVLGRLVETGQLTGRGYDRTLRVARTCADLDGAELVDELHVHEAASHRIGLAGPSSAGMSMATASR
jgi:magnesium chelatase family protein